MQVAVPSYVRTEAERCRVCFTCVRECPAKAIRISNGQAEIVPERCICCGNCVKVCSQGAKQIVHTSDRVTALLASGVETVACLAPSFPAEFAELSDRQLVGMIRRLGFRRVVEVAFGADLVARRYAELLRNGGGAGVIATTCPALVHFVERYHPALVGRLAPIVSPMVAVARALRRLHGTRLRVVFIGPCVAKKREAEAQHVPDDVDEVLTFVELRRLFAEHQISAANSEPADFDPPRAGLGTLFPVSHGLLQAAGIGEDLLSGNVIAADGRQNYLEALDSFEAGHATTGLLEILCCHGCIMGPGMTVREGLYQRRALVSRYARERVRSFDRDAWEREVQRFDDLDLSCSFATFDQRMVIEDEKEEVRRVLEHMGKTLVEDELNCGACGYDTCREHALAIVKGLAESEMCLPYTTS
jgi:iron only hydrogenase large subunit-like protein